MCDLTTFQVDNMAWNTLKKSSICKVPETDSVVVGVPVMIILANYYKTVATALAITINQLNNC